MAGMADTAERYPVRKEFFDVVLLKDAAAEHTAEPEDFLRIEQIEATSTMTAQDDPRVVKAIKEEGYHLVQVVPPNHVTAAERQAHARVHQSADRRDAERRAQQRQAERGARARR